jgi:hypothetical protein
VDLYIHSPIRLHDIKLNLLSTRTTLHFTVILLEMTEETFVQIMVQNFILLVVRVHIF